MIAAVGWPAHDEGMRGSEAVTLSASGRPIDTTVVTQLAQLADRPMPA